MASMLESNAESLEELLSQNEVDSQPADPILFVACQRELPNMEVICLIVDTGHVNVNAQSRTRAESVAGLKARGWTDIEDEPDPGLNTALHELAMGRHWWGVRQAIPCLLSKGADREIINEARLIPLTLARKYLPRGVFKAEAIEALGDPRDENVNAKD